MHCPAHFHHVLVDELESSTFYHPPVLDLVCVFLEKDWKTLVHHTYHLAIQQNSSDLIDGLMWSRSFFHRRQDGPRNLCHPAASLSLVFLSPTPARWLKLVFSSRESLNFGIIAHFIVIWQLISNYRLIKIKIFISYKNNYNV